MLDEIKLDKKDMILLIVVAVAAFILCLTAFYYTSGDLTAVTDIHKEAHEAAAEVKAIVEDAFKKEAAKREEIETNISHIGGASVADSINKLIREHRTGK